MSNNIVYGTFFFFCSTKSFYKTKFLDSKYELEELLSPKGKKSG